MKRRSTPRSSKAPNKPVDALHGVNNTQGTHENKVELSNRTYSLSQIYERNPAFFINDIPLAYNFLSFIKQNHTSFIINESSTFGKTSFFEVLNAIINQDTLKNYINETTCGYYEEKIEGLTKSIALINLNFTSIYNKVRNSKHIERDFIYELIMEIIEQSKLQLDLENTQVQQLDAYLDEAEQYKNTTANDLEVIHGDVLYYLIKQTERNELFKKMHSHNERKCLGTIVFTVNEANIFKLNNVHSSILEETTHNPNWYIHLVECTLSKHEVNSDVRCYSFVFTSVLPISIEREPDNMRLEFFYFKYFLNLFYENRPSFGEVTYEFYNKIAKAENDNKLKTFLSKIRTNRKILKEYLDENIGNESDEKLIIDKVWSDCFPGSLFKGNKMKPKVTQQELIDRSFDFFVALWGQYIYRLKFYQPLLELIFVHHFNTNNTEKYEYPMHKINTGRFMHFLMNDTNKNSISITTGNNIHNGKDMKAFWECYSAFRERYNVDNCSIPISNEHVGVLCDQTEYVENNSFNNTIRDAYYLGFIQVVHKKIDVLEPVKKGKQEDGSAKRKIENEDLEFELVPTNKTKEKQLSDCYQNYVREKTSSNLITKTEKNSFKKKTFNVKFWKDFINSLQSQIKGIRLIGQREFSKHELKDRFIELLNERLHNKVSSVTGIKSQIKLSRLVGDVECGLPFPSDDANIVSETSSIDVLIQLKIEQKRGERFYAVFELKTNKGRLTDLSVFKKPTKDYQTIGFLKGERKVYIGVSFNSPKFHSIQNSTVRTFSCVMGESLDAKEENCEHINFECTRW